MEQKRVPTNSLEIVNSFALTILAILNFKALRTVSRGHTLRSQLTLAVMGLGISVDALN